MDCPLLIFRAREIVALVRELYCDWKLAEVRAPSFISGL